MMDWQEFHKWRNSVYKTTEEHRHMLRASGLFRSERLKLQAASQNWQRRIRRNINNGVIVCLR